MKSLVVMPATIEALELCDNLNAQGFAVAHAPSGLYALTLMERDRPDLILAAADLPDNAIAVSPGTRVAEVLAQAGMLEVENASPDLQPHDLEHHSPDPMSTLEIEPDEFTQMDWTIENWIEERQVQGSRLKAPSQTASIQSASPKTVLLPTPESPTQSGQFKFENRGFIYLVLSLADLTAFARIEVRCGTTSGQLYIANNQLSHAKLGRQHGEDAARGLFLAAADHCGSDYVLHATDPETALRVPVTIHRPIHPVVLTWST